MELAGCMGGISQMSSYLSKYKGRPQKDVVCKCRISCDTSFFCPFCSDQLGVCIKDCFCHYHTVVCLGYNIAQYRGQHNSAQEESLKMVDSQETVNNILRPLNQKAFKVIVLSVILNCFACFAGTQISCSTD